MVSGAKHTQLQKLHQVLPRGSHLEMENLYNNLGKQTGQSKKTNITKTIIIPYGIKN